MGKNEAVNSSITPPLAAAIWQKGGKRYSTGEAIEAILADEDSNDESFDCGYDLDIIPDSENEGDSESSDLDIQIEGLRLQESNKAESLTGKNCNKKTL